MKVLVTGGSGRLGSRLVPRVAAAGHRVRSMTHSGSRVAGGEPVAGDLATGEGVDAAVAGADVVLHLASSPRERTQEVDVAGTRRLAESCARAGVRHLVMVSIVGIDRVPYPYYAAKLAAEQALVSAGVPWTVLRATQFHGFVASILAGLARRPLMVVPRGWKLQPVDAGEVAARLVALVTERPSGLLPDFAGPEVLSSEQLAGSWREANGISRPMLAVPMPGKASAALRSGAATAAGEAAGHVTWRDWLAGARG